ncbi:MAG: HAD family hydrolase [Actinomycetota bacterium]|nr:HAD family hydrolase [Actinomycetota bacterium]
MTRGTADRRRGSTGSELREVERPEHASDLVADVSLVVTDLDGTLWGSSTVVHDRTLIALKALRERAFPVLVATGRTWRSARRLLERNDLELPLVALNGAVCLDVDGSIFHRVTFPPPDALGVLRALRESELAPIVHIDSPSADSAAEPGAALLAGQAAFYGQRLLRIPLDLLVQREPVQQFIAYGPRESLETAARGAAPHGHCTINSNALFGGTALTVDPFGATKWQGVERFCEIHGLDHQRVLAVGNGENDVDLLEHARVACAVRDGAEEALAVATHVIDSPDAGGWAAVLDLLQSAGNQGRSRR